MKAGSSVHPCPRQEREMISLNTPRLQLTVDPLGAQMMSLKDDSGLEYLWQGDPQYWSDRAPTLFPFIGRLTHNSYRCYGKVYPMGIHGFAAGSLFRPVTQGAGEVELELREGADTLEQYPFSFRLGIRYRLRGEAVEIACTVENTGDAVMPFALGGHPGFRVPLEAGERFEDYRLEFSRTCQPDRVGFTPAVYLSGRDDAYPLEEGRYLPLRHDLFDQDAVILKNMARQVTLRSRVTGKGVEVTYPDMPYLGIWHWPKTDAPYVCIEPWTSLPSRQDVVEEFTCKSDLIHLAPGKVYENTWTIRIIK